MMYVAKKYVYDEFACEVFHTKQELIEFLKQTDSYNYSYNFWNLNWDVYEWEKIDKFRMRLLSKIYRKWRTVDEAGGYWLIYNKKKRPERKKYKKFYTHTGTYQI